MSVDVSASVIVLLSLLVSVHTYCVAFLWCYKPAPISFLLLYFLSRDLSCDHHVITSMTIVQVTYCPCDAIVL